MLQNWNFPPLSFQSSGRRMFATLLEGFSRKKKNAFSVGNKNDDPNSKVVETTDAQKFAEQMGINLFETSAKENINVEEV